MIEPLLAAVRTHVLGPLEQDDELALVTGWGRVDQLMPGATGATALPVDTVPVRPEIGNALGAPGSSIQVEHRVSIVVAVLGIDQLTADTRRNAVVVRLLREAHRTDWYNLTELAGTDQTLDRARWEVDYSDLAAGDTTRAFATLSLVFTCDWTP